MEFLQTSVRYVRNEEYRDSMTTHGELVNRSITATLCVPD